jgi:hypothetical protein
MSSQATSYAHTTALLRPPRITGRTKVAGLAVQGERSESRSDTEGALDGQPGDLTMQSAGEDEAPSHDSRELE